jgi:hypothetical protein
VECFGDFVTAQLGFVKRGVTLEQEAECHSAAGRLPAPQSGNPQTDTIVCAEREAGLTISRRMPSGPTAREEIKM